MHTMKIIFYYINTILIVFGTDNIHLIMKQRFIKHSIKNDNHLLKVPIITHHFIRARDGILLSTYVIRNMNNKYIKKSTVLSRSPYGSITDNIATLYTILNDNVAVVQDQRGTGRSLGNFSLWRDDADDGYVTMEWISKQYWSNGDIFTVGLSADGCSALTQMSKPSKWLKGQFIIFASANAYESIFPGGAFRKGLIDGWMKNMVIRTHNETVKHVLPEIINHEEKSIWWDKINGTLYYHNVTL